MPSLTGQLCSELKPLLLQKKERMDIVRRTVNRLSHPKVRERYVYFML